MLFLFCTCVLFKQLHADQLLMLIQKDITISSHGLAWGTSFSSRIPSCAYGTCWCEGAGQGL